MDVSKKPDPAQKPEPEPPRRLSAEDWVLVAGVIGVVLFLWIMALLFVPLLTNRPLSLPSVLAKIAVTRGFVLPPTWTPDPNDILAPTPAPTVVYDGSQPTRMYTPRATSLPGVPLAFPLVQVTNVDVIDLARILQGESPGDKEAAYYVGWVAKNRLMHPAYGDTIAIVSNGFFGYQANVQPRPEFVEIAVRILRARQDPTDGSLYALSRTDITNLGIPPHRADVTKGEWFFFKRWPLSGR